MPRKQTIEPTASSTIAATHIPAGPIWRGPTARAEAAIETRTVPQIRTRNKTVTKSAVIRPKPRSVGDGNLRLDPPDDPQPKQKYIARLTGYVNWLNDHPDEIENELSAESRHLCETQRFVEERLQETIENYESVTARPQNGSNEPSNRLAETELHPNAEESRSKPATGTESNRITSSQKYRFTPLTGNLNAMSNFFADSPTPALPSAQKTTPVNVTLPVDSVESTGGDKTPVVEFSSIYQDRPTQRTYIEIDTATHSASVQTNPLGISKSGHKPLITPVNKHRVDGPQSLGINTSRPHLSFSVESQIRNADKPRTQETQARPPQVGDVEKPFSDVTYDEKTAEVIATISAAIASVIQDQSEAELKAQADQLLQSATKPAVGETVLDDTAEDIGVVNDDMLHDIIRQRVESAHQPKVKQVLKQRIDDHHARIDKNQSAVAIPMAKAVEPVETVETAQTTVSSLDAFVTAQSITNTEPAIAVAVASEPPASPAESSSRVADIPLELAAWDVEDFRWPVVSNQMIVTGGASIEGLVNASISQLKQQPRRVAVTGIGRKQGTTSIAISVARWATAAGYRTLVVDADVASPSLSGRLGLASDMSWLNGINDEMPVSELIIRSKKSNICVMPLASSVTRVTWPRFIFDNLGAVLEPIQYAFDVILIDAGPASQLLDELSSPSRLIDSVMLVNDTAEPKKLDTFQTRLAAFGIEKFVVADNRVPESKPNVA
ncbi:MAG: hypothetical protein AAFN77_20915 [Planctomycetota bacterium]